MQALIILMGQQRKNKLSVKFIRLTFGIYLIFTLKMPGLKELYTNNIKK